MASKVHSSPRPLSSDYVVQWNLGSRWPEKYTQALGHCPLIMLYFMSITTYYLFCGLSTVESRIKNWQVKYVHSSSSLTI